MKTVRTVSLLATMGLLSVMPGGCAMGAPENWGLFSGVHGTVPIYGEPVDGTEVIESARITGNDAISSAS